MNCVYSPYIIAITSIYNSHFTQDYVVLVALFRILDERGGHAIYYIQSHLQIIWVNMKLPDYPLRTCSMSSSFFIVDHFHTKYKIIWNYVQLTQKVGESNKVPSPPNFFLNNQNIIKEEEEEEELI